MVHVVIVINGKNLNGISEIVGPLFARRQHGKHAKVHPIQVLVDHLHQSMLVAAGVTSIDAPG
jgi:hypothetical protein